MTDSSLSTARTDRRTGFLDRFRLGQQQVSDRVHAEGDRYASARGWTVTTTVSRLGMGGRTYRDPRFDTRKPARPRPNSEFAAEAAEKVTRQPVLPDEATSHRAQAPHPARLAGRLAHHDDAPTASPTARQARDG
jgi:hypothetical protein